MELLSGIKLAFGVIAYSPIHIPNYEFPIPISNLPVKVMGVGGKEKET